jgi:Lar family restriction alleviation protein
MSDEPELLPCPFCGGVEHEIGYDSAGHDVQCHSWTCRAKTGSHTSEAEAIAAWNRRAAPQRIEVDIGAAVAALQASPELAGLMNEALAAATPSRESSDELAALAARYLGMTEAGFVSSVDDLDQKERRLNLAGLLAEIKRLAGSVVSQARGDK